MSTHHHRPDPGRERAVELLLEAFDNERHWKDDRWHQDDHQAPARMCLGCGHASNDLPGNFECFGGGPRLYEWCTACSDEKGGGGRYGAGVVWEHRIPWPKFYRLIAPPAEGQLTLALA